MMADVQSNDAFPLMRGESASSFALRLATFLTIKPDRFLKSALGDARNLAWAIHRCDMLKFMSDASGLAPDSLSRAFARPAHGSAIERAVLDFSVSEHHLDQSVRRLSPLALAGDVEASRPPYHRLSWSLRDLRFDPETGSSLISACDHCGRTLTWENCVDPSSCGRCGRRLWRADPPAEPMTQFDLFVSDLFHPDPAVRRNRRKKLAFPLGGWSEGDLLDLLHTLRRVQRLFSSIPPSAEAIEPAVIEADGSMSDLLKLPIKAAARSGTSTAATIAAAATTATIRSSSPPVAAFLTSLLMSRT